VTRRDRTVLIVVVSLVLIVGSWLMVLGPRRSRAAKLQTQITAVQGQVDSARTALAQATAAHAAFSTEYASLTKLGEAVPADDDVPSLIYQLQNAASTDRVDFRSLQLGNTGGSASTTGTSGTGSTAQLPPGATVGPAGFPIEPFQFEFRGSFFHLASFFGRLQRLVQSTNGQILVRGRLLTVNAINLSAAPQGFPTITATITATTYLLPPTQGATAGATPSGPSAGSSQPVAAGASSTAAPAAALPPSIP
jgi:hypothetical protein